MKESRPIVSFSLKWPLGKMRAPSSERVPVPRGDMKAYEVFVFAGIAAAFNIGLKSSRESGSPLRCASAIKRNNSSSNL